MDAQQEYKSSGIISSNRNSDWIYENEKLSPHYSSQALELIA